MTQAAAEEWSTEDDDSTDDDVGVINSIMDTSTPNSGHWEWQQGPRLQWWAGSLVAVRD